MTNGSGPPRVAAAPEPDSQQQAPPPPPPAAGATFVQTTAAPSRGALTTDFLAGSMAPIEYLQVWQRVRRFTAVAAAAAATAAASLHAGCASVCDCRRNAPCSHIARAHAAQSLRVDGFFGFNLLVGDLATRQLGYYSNRDPGGPRLLAPGAYGAR